MKRNITMFKSRLQLLISVLIITLSVNSQDNADTINSYLSIEKSCIEKFSETVFVHLSKNSAIAGERLFYKAYILSTDKNNGVNSKILYMQLLNSKGVIVSNTRASINNQMCESSVTIPDSLSSGIYSVIAYTNFMRNMPASTYNSMFLIVTGKKYEPNLIVPLDEQNALLNSEPKDTNEFIASGKSIISNVDFLNATLNKQVYKRGEKATLSLELGGELEGNFSISVSEKLPTTFLANQPNIRIFAESFFASDDKLNNSELVNYESLYASRKAYFDWTKFLKNQGQYKLKYRPENISFLLEGSVFNKSNNLPLGKVKVVLTSPDSMAILKYCISDTFGRFLFPLNESFNNRKVILSVLSAKESEEYFFAIDSKLVNDNSFKFNELQLSKSLISYHFRNKEIALFNKLFSKEKDNFKPKPFQNTIYSFYGKPDYRVDLADYLVEFEDFNDICKNVLPAVRYRIRDNKKTIHMVDLNLQEQWKESCLILLNNIPFYDIDYLSTLGSKQINSIEVVYRNIIYGDINFYGVLSIFTKDKAIITNGHSLILDNKVEPSFEEVQKTCSVSTSNMQPDFRQLLYWNPNISLTNKVNTIEFYTSNLASSYVVEIEGITFDGKPISNKIEFKVK